MKILLLCDRYPDSYRDGLLLRVLHLVRRLKSRHQFDLLCFHDGPAAGEPADLFGRIWTVPRPDRQPARGWRGAFAGWDPRGLYPRSAAAEQLLAGEIEPGDYEMVWDAGASIFPNLPARWDAVPVVADLVDDMVLTFRRAMASEPSIINKLRLFKYMGVNLLFERYCMRRTTHCMVVSEEDAAVFHKVSPTVPVSVIQNGVDTDFFTPGDGSTVPGRLVFEGTMAFLPNRQAAIFLVNEIMPHIWARRPDASLTLVGRDPPADIRALASDRVFVTGAVDDVRPYVREAEVFVCPLQSGAGIKNKLLQAWAMNKAVVATSLSVGGLGARDSDNLLIRDDAESLASAVLALMENPSQREALGRRGRATVEGVFTWEAQAERVDTLLHSTRR